MSGTIRTRRPGALVLAGIVAVWLGAVPAAGAAEPRTAGDFYLAVPDGCGLPRRGESRRYLLAKQATVRDDARGYLEIENGGAEPVTYLFVWRRRQGGAVVGFTNRLGNDDHTYVRTELVCFLRYDPGGTWTDVTREVTKVTGGVQRDVACVLPREGDAVRLRSKGRMFAMLMWDESAGCLQGSTIR